MFHLISVNMALVCEFNSSSEYGCVLFLIILQLNWVAFYSLSHIVEELRCSVCLHQCENELCICIFFSAGSFKSKFWFEGGWENWNP